MPKSSRGGRTANVAATAQTVAAISQPVQNTQGAKLGNGYSTMSNKDADQIRQDVDDSYTPSVRDAIKQYISNTNYDGKGHSKSQTLNYKLENGLALNTNEKFMDKYLQEGMHALGKDAILYRGAHADMLTALGITNYSNLTEKQLQNALIGAGWQNASYSSTSYSLGKNPFLSASSGSGVSGGREIELKIKANAQTQCVFGAKSQTEIVLNKGTNYKITGVKYKRDSSGNKMYATPRNGGMTPILEIEVEAW